MRFAAKVKNVNSNIRGIIRLSGSILSILRDFLIKFL